MGFGLLFFGYFTVTLMSINQLGAFAELVGYAVILIASLKLNRYNSSFRYLSLAAVLMIAVSGAIAAADISSFLYDQLIISTQPLGDTYRSICTYVELGGAFVLHAAMLGAIRAIAIETGEFKNAMTALRNLVFVCLYYVLYLLAMSVQAISKYCLIAAVTVYFLYIVLNLVLIYSCYARICDEGDVEMEIKPSRFAFVNKMRAEAETRRAEAEARRAEKKRGRKSK